MLYRLFALLALVAVAFASPEPKPDPQVVAYGAGFVPATYPYYAGYAAAAPYAAFPYAYNRFFYR